MVNVLLLNSGLRVTGHPPRHHLHRGRQGTPRAILPRQSEGPEASRQEE